MERFKPESSVLVATFKDPCTGYLHQESRCILCLLVRRRGKGRVLTHDHLIPKLACRDFPQSLGEQSLSDLAEDCVNIITSCASCHREMDHGSKKWQFGVEEKTCKMEEYRIHGIFGLVDFLARKYLRSPDPDFLQRQQTQFTELFKSLNEYRIPIQLELLTKEYRIFEDRRKIMSFNPGKYETQLHSLRIEQRKLGLLRQCFMMAEDLTGESLLKWSRGDFAIEKLELS